MVAGAAIIAAIAVLLLTGSGRAATPGANPSRVLWQGPTFAGDGVVWEEEAGGKGSLHLWTQRLGERVVYRSDTLALGRPLAASSTLLAFERAYPSCPPSPGRVCPEATDSLVGPPAGPYRTLVRPRTCFTATVGSALALEGGIAAYRARIGPAPIDVDLGFALQQDGKLAVAYRLVELARTGPATVAWRSRSAPRLHVLRLRAHDTRVRIADDRIAFAKYGTAKTSALVVADLAGHARTVARFVPPTRLRGFDFDGGRIVWASDRVTATRTDCPPPGQGRPCVLRESGITTIWLQTLRSGAPRVVARLPYVDTLARP